MKIAVISASPRKGSNSLKVANHIAKLITAKNAHEVKQFSFEGLTFPSVAEIEMSRADLQGKQKELYELVVWAERVIFVVPEYNREAPSEYVEMVHQFIHGDFKEFWSNRIFAFVGVSSGIGGREPIYYSWKVFHYAINNLGTTNVHVSPYHFQSVYTGEQFNEAGEFVGNEKYATNIQTFVDRVLV